MLYLHDKAFLLRSFEIGFHPVKRGLSVSTPPIFYASLLAKPCERYHPFRANSGISYKVGKGHSPAYLRRETAAAGPLFLAAATTSGWPNYRIQDIHGSFCQYIKDKIGKCWTGVLPNPPIDCKFIFQHPPPCIPPNNNHHLYMLPQLPFLSMWFLQARCNLIFTIVNHTHINGHM